MMLDEEQGRLWTSHGKALGDELSVLMRFSLKRLQRFSWRGVVNALGSVLATIIAMAATMGIAVLPGLGHAVGIV